MASIQKRKNPQTTIAVNQEVITELDSYLEGSNLSRKEFVEKAVKYFIRTGYDIESSISDISPLQNVVEDLKVIHDNTYNQNNAIMLLLQNIHELQKGYVKALPGKQKIEQANGYVIRYNKAKKALLKITENKTSVRIGKIKNIIEEYFDL